MEQCNSMGCTRPAEVEKVQGADFCMTSTSTQSQMKIKLCVPCAEQDKRMKEFGQRPGLDALR